MAMTQEFEASVNGAVDTKVTWSVVEPEGGTIVPIPNTNKAIYTAPTTTGTFHVQATSVADPTKSALATIVKLSEG